MKLHIGSTTEVFSNGLLGYMVLSAKSTPVFPFLSSTTPVSHHIKGGVNGGLTFEASFKNQIYYPAKGIVFNAYSSLGYESQDDLTPIVDSLSNLPMDQEADVTLVDTLKKAMLPALSPFSTLCLERSDPFGMSILASKDSPLRLFGLFNDQHSILVVTNIDNYDDLIDHHFRNHWWLYRFSQRDSLFCVLFSRRVCSRWYRWGTAAPTENPYNRFAALERSLLPTELDFYS